VSLIVADSTVLGGWLVFESATLARPFLVVFAGVAGAVPVLSKVAKLAVTGL
jgi:hypothetical protein